MVFIWHFAIRGSKFITYYGITLSFAYNDVLYDYTINNKDTGSLSIRVSEGYLLRYNTPLLTFTIALILTIISSYMGRWVENRFPRFFGK